MVVPASGAKFEKAKFMVLRRVLLIGDHRHGEFASAIEWLDEHSLLSVAATPAEAIRAMGYPALLPELVVVAQPRPSQFAEQQLELVHRLAPLARLAVLAGSWCEGEMRTGHPWSGALRLYWHQGEARLRELLSDTSPGWSHPRTATEVERLLGVPNVPVTGEQKMIGIGTESAITYHGLAATCAAAGYASVWMPPRQLTMVHHVAAGIWDEAHRPESVEALHAFVKGLGHAPIVALLNFPRLADYQRLQAEGICQLIAKPFMNADLIGILENQLQAVAKRQQRAVA